MCIYRSIFNESAQQSQQIMCNHRLYCRYMHFSIDEACTHVGVKAFRIIAGLYDMSTKELLGTACSLPIRVVSNNDVPGGSAHITLEASIR